MCIGTPMQVVAVEDHWAWCEADGERERLDMILVGPQPVGTWVLGFQGAARQVMDELSAAQARSARGALASVLDGRGNIDDFFADLVGREPELPEHLRKKARMNNPPATADLHPLLARLVKETAAAVLAPETFDAWAGEPGAAMVVFAEDPERYKETLDLAVIVPELHTARPGAFRVALLPPAAARVLARRYGFARWPAFVMLRDGRYLGAVDGVRDWDEYVQELDRLLVAEPTRPPTVGIPVALEGQADSSASCH